MAKFTRRAPSARTAMIMAVIGILLALPAAYTLVPRVKLVEAVTLFAVAFGAGAAFAVAVMQQRQASRNQRLPPPSSLPRDAADERVAENSGQ